MKTDHFAFALLHKAHQIAKDAFDGELTATQYLILRAICEKGDGINQARLVSATGVDRSTMTDTLRRLVKHGHITRQRSTRDERSMSISLTDNGREALLQATEAASKANEAILGAIPLSQQRAFLRHLEAIARGPVKVVREAA